MNISINDPKVRWAQQIADKTHEQQALIRNPFGGVDIKRMSAVNLMCAELLEIIEPNDRTVKSEPI
jgi:hypothetical protein